MASKDKTVILKLVSAIALDGDVVTAGNLVEVDENLAKNLIHRGKAIVSAEHANASGDDDRTDLGKLNVEQLRAKAAELKLEGADKMNKAALVAAIMQAEAE